MNYMFMHKSFGTLAAGLMLPRLALRLASKAPGPLTNASWEQMLAKASHAGMYGFLIAMPATGVAMGYFGPKWCTYGDDGAPQPTPRAWAMGFVCAGGLAASRNTSACGSVRANSN